MSWLEPLKALSEAVGRLIPYQRNEFKYEFEIRLSDTSPCHQREVPVRHRWMIWHTQKYISHVDETGKVNIWLIGPYRSG